MNSRRLVNNELSYEINVLRGLACLLIVGVHVSANDFNSELAQFGSPVAFLMNQFGRVGTPIFAFLSAMLLFGSLKKHKELDVKRFFFYAYDEDSYTLSILQCFLWPKNQRKVIRFWPRIEYLL